LLFEIRFGFGILGRKSGGSVAMPERSLNRWQRWQCDSKFETQHAPKFSNVFSDTGAIYRTKSHRENKIFLALVYYNLYVLFSRAAEKRMRWQQQEQ